MLVIGSCPKPMEIILPTMPAITLGFTLSWFCTEPNKLNNWSVFSFGMAISPFSKFILKPNQESF